jgi:hypothetical protein
MDRMMAPNLLANMPAVICYSPSIRGAANTVNGLPLSHFSNVGYPSNTFWALELFRYLSIFDTVAEDRRKRVPHASDLKEERDEAVVEETCG